MEKIDAEYSEPKSTLVSRNITVLGRRTSVRLEPEMWNALREIAKREQCRIHDICSLVQMRKTPNTSLTAGIRVFLMLYYRAAATEEGHVKAAHGDFGNMLQRARTPLSVLRGAVPEQEEEQKGAAPAIAASSVAYAAAPMERNF